MTAYHMLFNSIAFLCFLPIVFLLYWFGHKSRQWQNIIVVVASYVFYGWWDWRFLFLIALTTNCSYYSGLLLEKYEGDRKKQKYVSAGNIIFNLAILGVFKYYNFFVGSLEELISPMGWHLDWATLNIVLPVGISFYTFQALSYTIDVYQGKIKATYDIIEFFAFISFFPQLVAGPIERAMHLLPQFQKQRGFEYAKAADGSRQMLWGFFKKVVIADNCGVIVSGVWGGRNYDNGLELLIGAFLFTIQIYCDFSGYSDIAIGCGRLFGIDLMRNFNYPYFSRTMPEFWRRWHISLMTWFRDYVYIPLGGNRCSRLLNIRNVIVVWAISGLWHGANWTFVCWGLYHGLLLVIYNLFGWNQKYEHAVAFGKWFPSFKEGLQIGFTFLLVMIGWILFRSQSITEACNYLTGIVSPSIVDITGCMDVLHDYMLELYFIVPSIIILALSEWIQREKQHALQFSSRGLVGKHAVYRYGIYVALLALISGMSLSQAEFIYFRF